MAVRAGKTGPFFTHLMLIAGLKGRKWQTPSPMRRVKGGLEIWRCNILENVIKKNNFMCVFGMYCMCMYCV